jgi:carbon monoxide dehydrogenase subunit G
MELSGMIRTSCPPRFLVEVLHKSDVLGQMLPTGSELKDMGDGKYSFRLVKIIGLLKLTLPGTLTIAPTGEGQNQRLTIQASHIIGGKVDMDMNFNFSRQLGVTTWAYVANVTASGLAGRILREREKRVGGLLRAGLVNIKLNAEHMQKGNEASA